MAQQQRRAIDPRYHDDPGWRRPSVDVLFESAADAYGAKVIGVVLTGSNVDGTRGARRIKTRGGIVIAQDPATAEAPEMPKGVIDAGVVDQILPLQEIAPYLVEQCVDIRQQA